MDKRELNLGAIIALEILIRAKQEQTSLPFPSLITTLCSRARVPHNKKIDVEVTPIASTDIRHIEAEFQRDEEDRARKKLDDKMLVINVETLKSDTVERAPDAGISFSSPSLHSSSALLLSLKCKLSLVLWVINLRSQGKLFGVLDG